jgi:hypothetical protein
MKIVTIDIEGDALSKDINQKLFPEGGHYDPDTRIWCVTFAHDSETYTYVCKLPNTVRTLPNGMKTKAYHEDATVVPESVDGHNVMQFRVYSSFIYAIYCRMCKLKELGFTVCFKGYGKYNYDKDMLTIIFDKFGLDTSVLECMLNVHKLTVGRWSETAKQISTGTRIPNQEYIIRGIRHNIEDCLQLYNIVREYVHERTDGKNQEI